MSWNPNRSQDLNQPDRYGAYTPNIWPSPAQEPYPPGGYGPPVLPSPSHLQESKTEEGKAIISGIAAFFVGFPVNLLSGWLQQDILHNTFRPLLVTALVILSALLLAIQLSSRKAIWVSLTIGYVAAIVMTPIFFPSMLLSPEGSPRGGSPNPTATVVPSLTATAYASTPPYVYDQEINIGSASGHQLRAFAYFGQLEQVVQRLSSVPFNIAPGFRQAHPTLCVGTFVVTNVPGNTAIVYSFGLETGWDAAEGIPDPTIAGADRNVHQQLVIPPKGTTSGTQWQAGAEVQGASFDLKTSTYTLKLKDRTASIAHWFVDGQGPVDCTML